MAPVVADKTRVVIIEDHKDSADSLRTVLQMCGFEALVAYAGPEGLDLIHKTQPSAVICDIGLPGLDGFQVAQAIRADEAVSDVTLIALTGYHQKEFREIGKKAGFDHHMVKPADLFTLVDWLNDSKK